MASLKGLAALVTGAASGLGRATTEHLIGCGAKVLAFDLPTSKGHEVASSLECPYVPGDVTSEEDVNRAMEQIQDNFGRLDVAVNCAGKSVAYTTYNFNKQASHHLDDFTNILMINTLGSFNVMRLSAKVMSRNAPDNNGQRGVLINTSGTSAYDGTACQSALAATCRATAAMTLPVARDLASVGIRCCTIAPGVFLTPLTEWLPKEVVTFLSESTPFPSRFGNPSEFVHMVQCIIENPMLNGNVIRLDGALRLQIRPYGLLDDDKS